MMTDRIWVLGAPDPEMELIERLLRECGETVVYAADARGERVTAGAAYRGESLVTDVGNHPCTSGVTDVYLVECELLTPDAHFEPGEDICHPELAGRTVRRIDHHRPGDPGYGRPPAEFLSASSIGQVIAELARLDVLPAGWRYVGIHPDDPTYWGRAGELVPLPGGRTVRHWHAMGVQYDYRIPVDYVLAAAADHCLAAAYRGECPGVDPDALMRWRAESRARFQRRSVEDVLADVERARAALMDAPVVRLSPEPWEPACGVHGRTGACWQSGGPDPSVRTDACYAMGDPLAVVDMRGQYMPELPEAAARDGVCFIADGLPGPDGRIKVVCQSGTPAQIEAFMRVWAPAYGLTDIYGDPARGFAGGYMPEME